MSEPGGQVEPGRLDPDRPVFDATDRSPTDIRREIEELDDARRADIEELRGETAATVEELGNRLDVPARVYSAARRNDVRRAAVAAVAVLLAVAVLVAARRRSRSTSGLPARTRPV